MLYSLRMNVASR